MVNTTENVARGPGSISDEQNQYRFEVYLGTKTDTEACNLIGISQPAFRSWRERRNLPLSRKQFTFDEDLHDFVLPQWYLNGQAPRVPSDVDDIATATGTGGGLVVETPQGFTMNSDMAIEQVVSDLRMKHASLLDGAARIEDAINALGYELSPVFD